MLDIKKLGKILVESKKGENKKVDQLDEFDFGYGNSTLIVHAQRLFDELLRLTDSNSTHLSKRELGVVFPSLSTIDISVLFKKINVNSRQISFEEFLDFIIGLDEKTRGDIFGCFRDSDIDEDIDEDEDIDDDNLFRRVLANLMEILGKIRNGLFIRCWVK